jgi:hypothetical protein
VNPPSTGSLTIEVDGNTQVFFAPFDSQNEAFQINGLSGDGVIHTVTGTFSNLTTCNASEDYTAPICPRDFGDLPENISGIGSYLTSLANNGPSHKIITGLMIGSTIDGELEGQPTQNADGDGVDEDGITFPSNINIRPGITIRLPITLVNTTGNTAYFEAWVDWNGDGDFDDANEMVADWDDNGGSFPTQLELNIPTTTLKEQALGIRLRLSNQDNMTPSGAVDSGEVEDYLMQVECAPKVCLPVQVTINRG